MTGNESKWISVKSELPEVDVEVLLWTHHGCTLGFMRSPDYWDGPEGVSCEPTHWQPLLKGPLSVRRPDENGAEWRPDAVQERPTMRVVLEPITTAQAACDYFNLIEYHKNLRIGLIAYDREKVMPWMFLPPPIDSFKPDVFVGWQGDEHADDYFWLSGFEAVAIACALQCEDLKDGFASWDASIRPKSVIWVKYGEQRLERVFPARRG